MSLISFRKSIISKYLVHLLFLLFIINFFSSFDVSQNHQKKADEQNVAFLDVNTNTNVLFDANKTEKRGSEKITGISDISNYYDNSINVIFKIYPAVIKNNLSSSISARTFIISFFSTDI